MTTKLKPQIAAIIDGDGDVARSHVPMLVLPLLFRTSDYLL